MGTYPVRLVADPYPPYQYQDGRVIRGVDHDVIAAAFQEEGLQVTTTLLPWDECVAAVKIGAADGIFQIQRTPERNAVFHFSDPLRTARTVFFTHKKSGFRFPAGIDPAQSLAKHRLGIVRGYGYDPMIVELPESVKVIVETQEELLQGVADGRYDVAIVDLGVAAYLSVRLGLDGLEKVEGFEIARVLHVGFRRNRLEMAGQFNAGLRRIRKKGIYADIFAQYAVTD